MENLGTLSGPQTRFLLFSVVFCSNICGVYLALGKWAHAAGF